MTYYWESVKFAAVIGAIFLIALFYTAQFDNSGFIRSFMGIFLIVFGLYKIIDLKGFVNSFRGYDLIASKSEQYAKVYPVIELALGGAYLLNVAYVNYLTVLLMGIGIIGISRGLFSGNKNNDVGLGTYIKLPLTIVSLIEYIVMGTMAVMIIIEK